MHSWQLNCFSRELHRLGFANEFRHYGKRKSCFIFNKSTFKSLWTMNNINRNSITKSTENVWLLNENTFHNHFFMLYALVVTSSHGTRSWNNKEKFRRTRTKKTRHIVEQMGHTAHAHISYIFHDPIVDVIRREILYWVLSAEIDFGFAFKNLCTTESIKSIQKVGAKGRSHL